MQEAEDLLKKLSVKSGSFIARPYGKLLSFARLVYSNFKAICDIMVLTAPPSPPSLRYLKAMRNRVRGL